MVCKANEDACGINNACNNDNNKKKLDILKILPTVL